ncbi:MAG: MbcA/ParS/Xre antitoxin family protein, partial [Xanthomonadales bacterium]|nr:MbcA/ParS/Xre antitoxin family protein [Xanthomonadales bacterium]
LMINYLRTHYSRWVDDPLPALDGRTPRQVATTPEGREQVEALVQGAERHDLALDPTARAAIFHDVRIQLGLIS